MCNFQLKYRLWSVIIILDHSIISNKHSLMKKIILFALLFITIQSFSQKKILPSSEKLVYNVMDQVATELMQDANIHCVSIAILKDGINYSKQYGEMEIGKGNKPDNNTYFEIASVTKVFTGTLVVNAVMDGKIKLEDDVRMYLPEKFPNLEYKSNPIRIKHLLCHESGIFRQFPDWAGLPSKTDPNFPPALNKRSETYNKEAFFKDLKTVKLDTMPGTHYAYTSLGPELCACILEEIYKKPYEQLLREIILDPLQMSATKLTLGPNEQAVKGYNGDDVPMPNAILKPTGAAGALKSTPADLLKFMRYELDQNNKLVAASHQPQSSETGIPTAYYWDIEKDIDGNLFYWKHGGAFGTQNMFIVCPPFKLGISIVVNQGGVKTAGYLMQGRNKLIDALKPFGIKSIQFAIKDRCKENIDAGIAYYKELKQTKSKDYTFSDENELNALGYYFLKKGDVDNALKLFDLNLSEFPNSANAYDSRGEAYFVKKDYPAAKNDYEKSYVLNPENTNAKEYLVKIEKALAK